MKKRGYKPAIDESKEIKNVVMEVNAYADLIPGLLQQIDNSVGSRRVTKAELIRDFGFTESSIRLLQRSKHLIPLEGIPGRPTYDLAKALRIRVLLPGLVDAKNVRTRRKRANIITVYKDFLNKITNSNDSQYVS